MKNNNITMSSNKSFGVVFFIFFFVISIFPLLNNENIKIWSLSIAIIFLILGLLDSKILTPFNKLWFKFGIFLGNFVSPIVMALIFFSVVTPTSLIMKLLNKNLLNLKKEKKETYWIQRPNIKSKMKNQF